MTDNNGNKKKQYTPDYVVDNKLKNNINLGDTK